MPVLLVVVCDVVVGLTGDVVVGEGPGDSEGPRFAGAEETLHIKKLITG